VNSGSLRKESQENSKEDDNRKMRANTLGNQVEINISSKKDIEKFLNLDEKKSMERRLSFNFSNDEHDVSLTFEEMKQNNFELIKEIYEIQQENMKNEENPKKMSENTNNDESIDWKFSLSTAKSLTNIVKNEVFIQSSEMSSEQKFLMKDKFIEVDMKYLNNV